MAAEGALADVIRCVCAPVVVDLGCGSGGSARLVRDVCGCYVLGVDLDPGRLAEARAHSSWGIDYVCADASSLPFRSSSVGSVVAVLTFHEMEESSVDGALEEAYRVLDAGGKLLVVDKFMLRFERPSEELVALAELAYQKAVEYSRGARLWGLREPRELAEKAESRGFTVLETRMLVLKKWRSGEEFLRVWDRRVLEQLSSVREESQRRELEELIQRVRDAAKAHGYGPTRAVAVLLGKS